MAKEIEQVSVNVLKVHYCNQDFIDNIGGEVYEKIKHSIKYKGILLPILVSPYMVILDGHKRMKAAKELGIKLVPVIILEEINDELSTLAVISASNPPAKTSKLQDRLEELMYLDLKQQNYIKEIAKKRVGEMIDGLIDGNSLSNYQKYFKIYIHNLYYDARHYAGLGSKISRTKKCDYQRCIDFIESWVPSCGCAALKAKADANAPARLEARKLGYLDELKKRKE